MHIHTHNYKYHKYNIGDRKHFLWHTTYFLYKYFPLQQIYIYITKAVPTDLRKPTVCTVTRWIPCSLLLHTVSKLPYRFKYLLTFPPCAMSQLREDGRYRCRRRMTLDISPIKYEGWRRSLEGSAVTKDPWVRQGLVYVGWYSPLDGMMIADDKWVARLLLIHQQPGLCLQNWLVCFCLSDPDALKQEQIYLRPRDALSFLNLCLNDATILLWL